MLAEATAEVVRVQPAGHGPHLTDSDVVAAQQGGRQVVKCLQIVEDQALTYLGATKF